MPVLYILIGLPGSGKSTWRAANANGAVIISSDDQVDAYAVANGITYSEAWGLINHKDISRISQERFSTALREGKDIVVDMTNMGAKRRRSWLAPTPATYRKIAVDFQIDDFELRRRIDERANATGKLIPRMILATMAAAYVAPSREEGFDEIIRVRS